MNDTKHIGLDVHQATISWPFGILTEAILETKTETILQYVRGLRWQFACNL